jgi:hypothetical protein
VFAEITPAALSVNKLARAGAGASAASANKTQTTAFHRPLPHKFLVIFTSPSRFSPQSRN